MKASAVSSVDSGACAMARAALTFCMAGGLLLLASSFSAQAQDRVLDFDIPAQPLSSAIRALSDFADIQVLYVESVVGGWRSKALHGPHTVSQALDTILTGSGLGYTFTAPGAVAIREIDPDADDRQGIDRYTIGADRHLDLGTIVVSNVRNPLESLPASTTILSGEEIVDKSPLRQPVDVLRGVPGLQVSTLSQGGFRERFIIRGFASAGESVASFLDGAPLNESNGHGDGSIDLGTIIPEEIDRVEVIRGPVSPLYGNFSRSASINFITKNRVDETMARYTLGGWGTRRAAATLGRVQGKFSQYYAIDSYRSAGFRENSDSMRTNMSARWTYLLSPRSTLRFSGRSYAAKWNAPGYLTQAEWDAGQWQESNTDLDGGEKKRYDLSVNYNYAFSDADSIGLTAFMYNTDFHRWRDIGSPQVEEHNALTGVMVKALYSRRESYFSARDDLLFGVDLLQEDGVRQTWNNTIPWTRTEIAEDGDYYQRSYSLYTQMEMKPSPKIGVMLGLRYDRFDVSLDRKEIESGAHTGAVSSFDNVMATISPKVAISYDPSPAWTIFGNAGKGFYLPAMFDKFLSDTIEPVDLSFYELGMRVRPGARAWGSVSLFRIDAENDVTREGDPRGPLVNAGDVRRQGIEVQAGVTLADGLDLLGSVSYFDAEFRDYASGGVDLSGNVPTEVPPYFYTAGMDYFSEKHGIGARLTLNGKGAVWLSNENVHRYGSYAYLDAQAYVHRGPYLFDIKLGNVTNRRYAEYAFSGVTPGSQRYGPARPFNVTVSVTARF